MSRSYRVAACRLALRVHCQEGVEVVRQGLRLLDGDQGAAVVDSHSTGRSGSARLAVHEDFVLNRVLDRFSTVSLAD